MPLDPALLAAYLLACLVLVLTPGPDMMFVLGQTLSGGPQRGWAAVLGIVEELAEHATGDEAREQRPAHLGVDRQPRQLPRPVEQPGDKVEVGVGAGTDFINWVRNGAVATGVDARPGPRPAARPAIRARGRRAIR